MYAWVWLGQTSINAAYYDTRTSSLCFSRMVVISCSLNTHGVELAVTIHINFHFTRAAYMWWGCRLFPDTITWASKAELVLWLRRALHKSSVLQGPVTKQTLHNSFRLGARRASWLWMVSCIGTVHRTITGCRTIRRTSRRCTISGVVSSTRLPLLASLAPVLVRRSPLPVEIKLFLKNPRLWRMV